MLLNWILPREVHMYNQQITCNLGKMFKYITTKSEF